MKRQDYFTVRLLTKPYIKKYMQTLYGKTIYFTTSNFLGVVLSGLLERPNIARDKREVLKRRADRFNTELQIFCPLWFLKKKMYGHYLTDHHIVAINKLYETMFTEDLFRFCYLLKLVGVDIEDAIYEFCKVYDIEIDVDITFDALKQKEYRYRKEIEKKLDKEGGDIISVLKRPIQIPIF